MIKEILLILIIFLTHALMYFLGRSSGYSKGHHQGFIRATKAYDLKMIIKEKLLLQQAGEILRYLESAYPAQTVVPQRLVNLFRITLEKEIKNAKP